MADPAQKYKFDLKVLYCEDARESLHSLNKALLKRFREVILASDGLTGLAKYKNEKPDLIITDIRMPNLNGLQMVQQIRENDNHIKIIIISAYTDVDYFLEAIDYGINAFIKKPVDYRILDAQLQEITDEIFLQKRIQEEEKKRIAIQKEHERLYWEIKQDLSLARSVQEYLLPEWLLISDKLLFSTAYTPSLDVGGDLFGYFPLSSDKFIFYLGDVSGHGLKSAMLMMAAYSTINMLIDQEKPDIKPARFVNRLNKILCQNLFLNNNYMTFILGTVDLTNNEVCYIRAGHPEIIIFDHQTGQSELLINSKGTIPVGWMDNYHYSDSDEECFQLNDNQTVFLYSDGLFECVLPDGSRLGQEALIKEMNWKIPQTHPLTSSLEFMEYIKEIGFDIRQDDFTLFAFFKPTYSTIPGLREYFQAVIPEDIELGSISCREFLFRNTADAGFADSFEKDINELFHSEIFRRDSKFISGFILMLTYDTGPVECLFWMKSGNADNPSSAESVSLNSLNEKFISQQLNSLCSRQNNYRIEINYKTLGDILQITCLLTPSKS